MTSIMSKTNSINYVGHSILLVCHVCAWYMVRKSRGHEVTVVLAVLWYMVDSDSPPL